MALVAGLGAAAVGTERGRELLARGAGAIIGAATGFDIHIAGLGPGLPFRLTIGRLTVADADGVWLTAKAVDVAVLPRALLDGRLVIANASVDDLALDRLPSSGAAPSGETPPSAGFSLPHLPVVHRLAMPRVRLAPPVLGEAVTLHAEGGIGALADGRQHLSLIVARSDGGGPADRLSVSAEGAANHWRGGLTAAVAGWGGLDLRFDLDSAPEIVIDFGGDARLDDALALPVDLGTITLKGNAAIDGEDRIAVRTLDVGAAGARLTATGSIDGNANVVDLALHAEVPAELMAALSSKELGAGELEIGAATLEAKLSGALSRPSVGAKAVVNDIAIAGVSAGHLDAEVQVAPAAAPSGRGGDVYAVTARVNSAGMAFGEPTLSLMLGDAPSLSVLLTADLAASSIADASAVLDGAHGRLGVQDGSFANGKWQAGFSAEVDDVAAVMGPAPPMAMRGKVAAEGHAAGAIAEGTIEAGVRVEGSDLAIADAALQAALGPRPVLTADARRDATGEVVVDKAVLNGANARAEASARYRPEGGTLTGKLVLRAERLAPLLAAVGVSGQGDATVEAVFDGAAADPDTKLTAVLARADLAGVRVSSARAEVNFRRPLTAPNGTVRLNAVTAFGTFAASSDVALRPTDVLDLRALTLRGPGLDLAGRLAVPLSGRPVSGEIKGRFAAEAEPAAYGDLRLGGRADVSATLADQGGRQNLAATLAGQSLALSGADGAMTTVKRLDARLNASGETVRFFVSADGPAGLDGTVSTQGQLSRAGDAWRLALDTLTGKLRGQHFALQTPTEVRFGGASVAVSPFAFSVDGGHLSGEGRWQAGGGVDASLTATRLPLSLLHEAVSTVPTLGGTADLQCRVWNSGDRLAADVDLEIKGAGKSGGKKPAVLGGQLKVSGRLRDGDLALTANGKGPGDATVDATLTTPVIVSSRDFGIISGTDAALSGSVHARAALAPLAAALGLDGQSVAGDFTADMGIAGTMRAPRLSGDLGIARLGYENFTTGTIVDRGRVVGTFNGDRMDLTLSARDGGEGHIDGDGMLRFGGEPAIDTDLTVRFADAKLLRRDDVTATATGQVRYHGTAVSGTLSGQVTATPVEVHLVDRLPPSVVVLHVTEVGHGVSKQAPPPEVSAPPAWQAKLDLALDLPRRIFVRGRGLDVEWAGSLRVTGTTVQPRVIGRFDLVRGSYDFAGKRFDLTKGVITLRGGDGTDAIVDVVAERRTADITAIITATGPATHPKIELSADKDLPQSEILSRVLFNKSSAKLGPIEAVQLGSALQALASGNGVGEDPMGFVRKLLGLDVLSVGSNEESSTPTVSAGRYVGNHLYVGGTQGTEPGTSAGSVAVEIAPGISLESQVQPGGEETSGSIGLRWKWDY